MSKSKTTTVTKTFAEEGLEEIQENSNEAETNLTDVIAQVGEGEWEDLSALEPVAFYYRTTTPRKVTSSSKPFKILESGQSFTGVYTHKHVGGKYNSPTYFIRLTEGDNVGKLVGISGYYKGGDPTKPSGSLAKQMEKREAGTVEVNVLFSGMREMKGGDFEGTEAATFIVRSRPLKK